MNTPWDHAKNTHLIRVNPMYEKEEELEPGVNYFILGLEKLGAKPLFSCEGHPHGFYIQFACEYHVALKVSQLGFFPIYVVNKENVFSITLKYKDFYPDEKPTKDLNLKNKDDYLRIVSCVWERKIRVYPDLSFDYPLETQ